MNALIKYAGAVIGFIACASAPLRAQQVQAALAQDHVGVGQPVQLNVTITGGGGANLPDRIHVEGLDIRRAGQSEQAQVTMVNGQLSAVTSAVHTYLIVPIKAGTYTIPAMSIQVGGKVLQTQDLTLTVGGAPGGRLGNVPVRPAIPVPQSQQRPAPGQPQVTAPSRPQPPTEDQLAFGELVIPRKTVYVGEVVPVEIRYFFGVPGKTLQEKPNFSGDGFTVSNIGEPGRREQEINGRLYQVLVYQTAITPVKAGPLEIPPAVLPARLQVATSRRADDIFSGLFGSMGDFQDVPVKTEPATLEVKALPKEGRPPEFAGAIGQFSIEGSADPKKAAAGDTISLNVKVAGRGNFDAMGAPVLIESEGWRTYPPGEKFTPSPSDPIGFNGSKAYEYMILAREDRTATPVAEFSYFDPSIEKYVTLKTSPIAVDARGGAAPAATPSAVAAVPTATPAVPVAPEPAAQPETSVLVRTFTPATFQPFVESRAFLVVNGALALTWAGLLLFGVGRVISGSESARAAAARKEARKLLHQMQPSSCPPERFFQLAADFVAARLGSHSRDALENAPVSPETKAAVGAILDTHDEMKYSTAGTFQLSMEDRRRFVTQLKSFDEELH